MVVANMLPGDPTLFRITALPASITLTFTSDASEQNLPTTGFRLRGITTDPDATIVIDGVFFSGFATEPIINPTVTNSGLPGNRATIEWTSLAGARPTGINPTATIL